jgi:hypothetical protein
MNMPTINPANLTRRTVDLPARFRREGRRALIPLYHLLRLSDFAREGIDHSGSYRFADHLYRNQASGTGWFGRWLDRRLLNLAASQAMRARYLMARDTLDRVFRDHLAAGKPTPFRILTVPCGIPRDVAEFVGRLAATSPHRLRHVEYHGIDLDPAVIEVAKAFLAGSAITKFHMIKGNALCADSYSRGPYHFIASTGLGEFLTNEELALLYKNLFDALAPGGSFFTSATACEGKSDTLLRTFELHSHYRTRTELEAQLVRQPWASVGFELHSTGLQTFVHAIKG